MRLRQRSRHPWHEVVCRHRARLLAVLLYELFSEIGTGLGHLSPDDVAAVFNSEFQAQQAVAVRTTKRALGDSDSFGFDSL